MVPKRSVLNSLSLSDLKKIASALHIDLTPKISEIPLVKIRGEKYFIVDKLSRFRGLTIEDIDEVIGTNYSKKSKKTKEPKKIKEERREEEEVEFLEFLLDKFLYKEELQDLLDDLDLPVSGNKDELIDRIVQSGMIDESYVLSMLNKDILVEICDFLELETRGTKAELKKRILKNVGVVEEFEEKIPHKEPTTVPTRPPPPPPTVQHPQRETVAPTPPVRESLREQPKQIDLQVEFNQVVNSIHQWIPKVRRSTEEGYKSDLAGFLEYKRGYFVREESGETKADIMIENRIPIELKKNPTQQGYDRLAGQMGRHHRAKNCVIAVICDVGRYEQYEDFKHLVDFQFRGQTNVKVIKK